MTRQAMPRPDSTLRRPNKVKDWRMSVLKPDDPSGVKIRQGDRRRVTLRVLAYTLPTLAVIGLVLYAYFYPFN